MAGTLRSLWADSDLRAFNCCQCGVEFAITLELENRRRADKAMFYCPNGHSQYFPGQTPDQKRIAALEADVRSAQRAKENAEQARKWAEKNAQGARISAGKAKAEKKRLEHRIHCGVCPHCHRTFKQLAAHMKAKHGDKP